MDSVSLLHLIQENRISLMDLFEYKSAINEKLFNNNDYIGFMRSNFGFVSKIAFNFENEFNFAQQSYIGDLLCKLIINDSTWISDNTDIIDNMEKCLNKAEENRYLICFASKILYSFAQSKENDCLIIISEKRELFLNIIAHLHIPCVYSYIEQIISSRDYFVSSFLENVDAGSYLFQAFEIKPELYFVDLLVKLCNMAQRDSYTLSDLADQNKLKLLLFTAKNAQSNLLLARNIYSLFIALYNQIDLDYSDYDLIDSEFYQFLTHSYEDFINELTNSDSYGIHKPVLTDLIILVSQLFPHSQEGIITIFSYLIRIFFMYPFCSILHNSCCYVLKVILKKGISISEAFSGFPIQEKIVEVMELRNNMVATYWGHVYSMIDTILGSEMTLSDTFLKMVDSIYEPIKSVLAKDYGGRILKEKLEKHEMFEIEEETYEIPSIEDIIVKYN